MFSPSLLGESSPISGARIRNYYDFG